MAKDIPVYVFTGFMDSGKTTLIQETLFENDFAAGGEDRILILSCEDGDVEYDIEKLKTINAKVATIDSEEEFNLENLTRISNEYKPDVIFLEYNGTWGVDKIYDEPLPEGWVPAQSLATVDAKARALEIAKSSGNKVCGLLSARSGVFQIRKPLSTDISDYGIYNTSSKEKEIAVTVTATFKIK